jgi:hypothetical protein
MMSPTEDACLAISNAEDFVNRLNDVPRDNEDETAATIKVRMRRG